MEQLLRRLTSTSNPSDVLLVDFVSARKLIDPVTCAQPRSVYERISVEFNVTCAAWKHVLCARTSRVETNAQETALDGLQTIDQLFLDGDRYLSPQAHVVMAALIIDQLSRTIRDHFSREWMRKYAEGAFERERQGVPFVGKKGLYSHAWVGEASCQLGLEMPDNGQSVDGAESSHTHVLATLYPVEFHGFQRFRHNRYCASPIEGYESVGGEGSAISFRIRVPETPVHVASGGDHYREVARIFVTILSSTGQEEEGVPERYREEGYLDNNAGATTMPNAQSLPQSISIPIRFWLGRVLQPAGWKFERDVVLPETKLDNSFQGEKTAISAREELVSFELRELQGSLRPGQWTTVTIETATDDRSLRIHAIWAVMELQWPS